MEMTAQEFGSSIIARCLKQRYDPGDDRRADMMTQMYVTVMTGAPKDAVAAFRSIIEAEKLDLLALQVIINAEAVRQLGATAARQELVASREEIAEGVNRLLTDLRFETAEQAAPGEGDAARHGVAGPLEVYDPSSGSVAEKRAV